MKVVAVLIVVRVYNYNTQNYPNFLSKFAVLNCLK